MELHLSNDRKISHFRNRYDLEPSPANTLTFAFEDRRYLKLARQIKEGEDVLKRKCLIEINEDFHKQENLTLALLSSRILEILIDTIKHSDNGIRELASHALIQVGNIKLGKEMIQEMDMIEQIISLINDSEKQIRKNCYQCLINFNEYLQEIDYMLSKPVLCRLIDKLVEEREDQIQILNLRLIEKLLYGVEGVKQTLKTSGIDRLLTLSQKHNIDIVSHSVDCLSAISFNEEGKQSIVDQKGVLIVCQKLYDKNDQTLISASKCLASLAQLIIAKKQIIHNDHFKQVITIFKSNLNLQIKLNVVQLISSLAEDPEGRQYSIDNCLELLRSMVKTEDQFLVEYIEQTIEVITWIP